jgi:hypothetical protein
MRKQGARLALRRTGRAALVPGRRLGRGALTSIRAWRAIGAHRMVEPQTPLSSVAEAGGRAWLFGHNLAPYGSVRRRFPQVKAALDDERDPARLAGRQLKLRRRTPVDLVHHGV